MCICLLYSRWNLQVEALPDSDECDLDPQGGADIDGGLPPSILPLDVMNNYFSLGADAHVSLEFHESRGAWHMMCLIYVVYLIFILSIIHLYMGRCCSVSTLYIHCASKC